MPGLAVEDAEESRCDSDVCKAIECLQARGMARILVTGAGGFIGRHLVGSVPATFPEDEVIAVYHRPPGAQLPPGPVLNLVDEADWLSLEGPFDIVFHAAAQIPRPGVLGSPIERFRGNERMAEHLLEATRRWRTRRLVFASSISVYPMGAAEVLRESLPPRPLEPYGTGKLVSEHVLNLACATDTEVVSLRFSSVYGPGMTLDSVITAFARRCQAGQTLLLFDGGKRQQDFVYVGDAVSAMLLAARHGASGVYNVGSGVATTMAELASIFTALPGWDSAVEFDRNAVERAPSVRLDITRAAEQLGYAPQVGLKDGLVEFQRAFVAGRS